MITVFTRTLADYVVIADTEGDGYREGPGRSNTSPVVALDRSRVGTLALPFRLLLEDTSLIDAADRLIDHQRPGPSTSDPNIGHVMDIAEAGQGYALVCRNIHVDLVVSAVELVAILRAAGATS